MNFKRILAIFSIICIAFTGVVNGDENGNFNPEDTVSIQKSGTSDTSVGRSGFYLKVV